MPTTSLPYLARARSIGVFCLSARQTNKHLQALAAFLSAAFVAARCERGSGGSVTNKKLYNDDA